MSRRLLGTVVIVAALLAALVTSGLRGTEVAGDPAVAFVPGPPTIGACLTEPATGVGVETSQADQPVFNNYAIGSCSGNHHGEVVAVTAHAMVAPRAPTIFQPYEQWCGKAVETWLGSRNTVESFSADWTLASQAISRVAYLFAGPNRLQTAAGQQWVACIAVPQAARINGLQSGTTYPYAGSIRGGLDQLPAPPGLAMCELQQSGFENAPSADCTKDHRAEVIGFESLENPTGTPQASTADHSSCVAFAARATGMSDPTAGGRLSVDIEVDDVAQPGALAAAWCLITPSAATDRLFGVLLGLGDQPVPLR